MSNLNVPEKCNIHKRTDVEKSECLRFINKFKSDILACDKSGLRIVAISYVNAYNSANNTNIPDIFISGIVTYGLAEMKRRGYYSWRYPDELKLSFIDDIFCHLHLKKYKLNNTETTESIPPEIIEPTATPETISVKKTRTTYTKKNPCFGFVRAKARERLLDTMLYFISLADKCGDDGIIPTAEWKTEFYKETKISKLTLNVFIYEEFIRVLDNGNYVRNHYGKITKDYLELIFLSKRHNGQIGIKSPDIKRFVSHELAVELSNKSNEVSVTSTLKEEELAKIEKSFVDSSEPLNRIGEISCEIIPDLTDDEVIDFYKEFLEKNRNDVDVVKAVRRVIEKKKKKESELKEANRKLAILKCEEAIKIAKENLKNELNKLV